MTLALADSDPLSLAQLIPEVSALLLLASCWPLILAWKGTRGTTLRPAVAWAGVAVGLGLVAQGAAITAPMAEGRPQAGGWCYLACLATLASLISVLGARTPGGGAWAILMGLLILVFLIPWLEGWGLAGGASGLDRLRLDPPWAIFFGLLIVAGVTNHLPTRFGPAAAIIGLGLVTELVALTVLGLGPRLRALAWSIAPGVSGLAALAGWGIARGRRGNLTPFDRLWLGFRDRWGVVWALRVRERFLRAAEAAGWPVTLAWEGLTPAGSPVPAEAEATLKGLLRRFATPEGLDRLADGGGHLARATPPGDDGWGERGEGEGGADLGAQ